MTMVHTSKVYKYASYEEYRDNGMFSSEANCMQFLYDLKILRTNHQCPRCRVPMALQECPATKYREGCCWKCKCGKTIAPRVGSILENSHVTYEEFIKILAYFAEGKSVTSAAQHGNLAKDTVRRFYNKIHLLKSSSPPSSSVPPPSKKKKKKEPKPSKITFTKKAKGKRTHPIGGAELQSDIEVTAGLSQRSVGQTCQPKTSDAAATVIRCLKCDDVGHAAIFCTGVSATERPPPFFCHQCSVSYKYTSSTEMTASIQLCSAHSLEAEEMAKRKAKAERILKKVTVLATGGTSLGDAVKLVGLDEQKYNKLRILFNL